MYYVQRTLTTYKEYVDALNPKHGSINLYITQSCHAIQKAWVATQLAAKQNQTWQACDENLTSVNLK